MEALDKIEGMHAQLNNAERTQKNEFKTQRNDLNQQAFKEKELEKKEKIEKRQAKIYQKEGKPQMFRSKMKAVKKPPKKIEVSQDVKDRQTYLGDFEQEEGADQKKK